MKKVQWILGAAAFTLFLGACATPIAGPGDKPAEVPPRIVDGDQGKVWNDPSAFGPVPAASQAKGDAICQQSGFKKATGYHPRAQDAQGKAFPGGAYFCVQ